ncbi:MAG TPA: Asp-tRNA(Asn)/Glu-tRNA(Gln) amidotransferase subunit GatC, partial [Acidimicrobiales bacterium]|nr:Asp-tRNA(Asn)/Glu-tRNA(Gln) amidotransferase subunit GatC [Acidimicrobiales bacterium]
MAAEITRDDVAHVARLARLELTDEEIDLFTGQLGAVLENAEAIRQLDTAGVPPMAHPLPLQNVLREDEPHECSDRD